MLNETMSATATRPVATLPSVERFLLNQLDNQLRLDACTHMGRGWNLPHYLDLGAVLADANVDDEPAKQTVQ